MDISGKDIIVIHRKEKIQLMEHNLFHFSFPIRSRSFAAKVLKQNLSPFSFCQRGYRISLSNINSEEDLYGEDFSKVQIGFQLSKFY